MNTATVLKEGYLFKKISDEVVKKVNEFETGYGNSDEFQKWQEKMKIEDISKDNIAKEKRKILSKLVYEEAILAKAEESKKKKKLVENLKNDKQILFAQLVKKKNEDLMLIKQKASSIQQQKINSKEIQEKLKIDKKKMACSVNEESQKLIQKAIEEVFTN